MNMRIYINGTYAPSIELKNLEYGYQAVNYNEQTKEFFPEKKTPWFPIGVNIDINFMDALEVVEEWGLNSQDQPRKRNKVGIYDHKNDQLYTQEQCFAVINILL